MIPTCEFLMGSSEGGAGEKPVHRVAFEAFYLDTYEVTNKRFQQFVRDTGSEPTAGQEGAAQGMASAGQWTEVAGANWRQSEGGDTVFVTNRMELCVWASAF